MPTPSPPTPYLDHLELALPGVVEHVERVLLDGQEGLGGVLWIPVGHLAHRPVDRVRDLAAELGGVVDGRQEGHHLCLQVAAALLARLGLRLARHNLAVDVAHLLTRRRLRDAATAAAAIRLFGLNPHSCNAGRDSWMDLGARGLDFQLSDT